MHNPNPVMVKILIVEDHQIVRIGLKMSLQKDFLIVGEAEDGIKAVQLATELKPDVVLMDIGLPRMDGVKAAKIIKHDLPDLRVIMLTSHNSDKDIFAALIAGADGYCLKEIRTDQLVLAILAVAKGFAWLDPAIATRVLSWAVPLPSAHQEAGIKTPNNLALSNPELAVLRLIGAGQSDQTIADRLNVDLRTVGNNVRRIIDKVALLKES